MDLFEQVNLLSCFRVGCNPTILHGFLTIHFYKRNEGIRIERRRAHYAVPSLQMQEPSIGKQDAWLWQWQVEVQLVPYSPGGQVWEQSSP